MDDRVIILVSDAPGSGKTTLADEVARRFAERARAAHPAHPLKELSAEMIAEFDRPMTTGTVIEVDTTTPVDLDHLANRIVGLR